MKELYCVSVNITELVEQFSGHLQPHALNLHLKSGLQYIM